MALWGICAGRRRLLGHFCVGQCTSAAVVFAMPPHYAPSLDVPTAPFSLFSGPISVVVALSAAEDVPDGPKAATEAQVLSALSFFA